MTLIMGFATYFHCNGKLLQDWNKEGMSSDSCSQKKKNHSGECKGARIEFKYVDVIPKKGKKKNRQSHQKCSTMLTLFSEILNKDLS